MRYLWDLLPGWAGTLFVSACCLGAGPLLASAAVASGAGFLAAIFNIYVLGPLVVLSVAWTIFNAARWSRLARGSAHLAPAFWLTALGGVAMVAGVFLPPLAGVRAAGAAAIYAGMAVMLVGTLWNALDCRKRRASSMGYAGVAGSDG